jgi:uncharacterized repeat protein (TIGR03803 family)
MTSLNAWKMAGVVFVLLATTAIAAQAQIFTTLVDFDGTPSGSGPLSPIIQGGDGNFYGTTGNGGVDGWGSVFKTSPQGTLTILQSFTYNDGFLPFGALLLDQDGNFHGTTNEGGFSNACVFGCGTLFQMTPVGVLTTFLEQPKVEELAVVVAQSSVSPPVSARSSLSFRSQAKSAKLAEFSAKDSPEPRVFRSMEPRRTSPLCPTRS